MDDDTIPSEDDVAVKHEDSLPANIESNSDDSIPYIKQDEKFLTDIEKDATLPQSKLEENYVSQSWGKKIGYDAHDEKAEQGPKKKTTKGKEGIFTRLRRAFTKQQVGAEKQASQTTDAHDMHESRFKKFLMHRRADRVMSAGETDRNLRPFEKKMLKKELKEVKKKLMQNRQEELTAKDKTSHVEKVQTPPTSGGPSRGR